MNYNVLLYVLYVNSQANAQYVTMLVFCFRFTFANQHVLFYMCDVLVYMLIPKPTMNALFVLGLYYI